jgi:carbonic anhydrase
MLLTKVKVPVTQTSITAILVCCHHECGTEINIWFYATAEKEAG